MRSAETAGMSPWGICFKGEETGPCEAEVRFAMAGCMSILSRAGFAGRLSEDTTVEKPGREYFTETDLLVWGEQSVSNS